MDSADVGVVGDDVDVPSSGEALSDTAVVGDATTVLAADVDVVVTCGEGALLSVARNRPEVPVLPVDAGRGIRSIPRSSLPEALERLGSDRARTESQPLIDVVVDGEVHGPALFDTFLVTAEPAHISEYAIAWDGEPVAELRADGVVVATPAGTAGYARTTGSPVVPPETDVLTVVPVAPFATGPDHWVVPDDDLVLRVERDEAAVELRVDDRVVGPVNVGEEVTLSRGGDLETIVVPESRSPFGRDGGELEKL